MAVLPRVILLAAGMAALEIGLGSALVEGSPGGWALILVVGLPALIAGSAGFMGPLLASRRREGSSRA